MSRSTGCHLLGDFLHLVREEYWKARQVYEYNCRTYKNAKSCNSLGTFLFEGRGARYKDLKGALKFFEQACDYGSGPGCCHMGQMLLGKDPEVVKAGVKPDVNKALHALEKGCDLDVPDSCFEAACAYLNADKFGVTPELEKAFRLTEVACNHSSPHFEACNNLMLMHRRGIGTKKDPEAAKKVQEKVDDYVKTLEKESYAEFQRGT